MVISECVCCASVVLVNFIICDQRPILLVNWKFILSEFMVYFHTLSSIHAWEARHLLSHVKR